MSNLPLVIDTVSQEEHHKMDALVEDFLDQLQCPRSPSTTHQLVLVLYGVFLIWPEGLNEPMTFRKFLDLVDSGRYGQRKALEDALKHARLAGDYNAIHRIQYLRPSDIPLVQNINKNEASDKESTLSAVQRLPPAWREPYEGHAAMAFLSKALDGVSCQTIHVIQSSGTGKSRMVDEAAKSHFIIPLCLRSEDSEAFPRADESIRDFLRVAEGEAMPKVKRRYALLLASLFTVIAQEVRPLVTHSTDHVTLARTWRKYLQTGEKRKQLYDKAVSLTEREYHDPDRADEPWSDVRLQLVDATERLSEVIPRNGDTIDIDFIVCFDDAQFLLKQIAEDEEYWSFSDGHQILLRIMESLKSSWNRVLTMVFLSSTPGLITHRPEHVNTPRPLLEHLFVNLPFDLMPEHAVAEGCHRLVDVCEDKFMVLFGRRLWQARWANARSPEERAAFVNFAMGTLTNFTCDYETTPRLAYIGVRILIEFERSRPAIKLEEHLVENHMRLLFGVPSHRNFPFTGYRSEPILAEAAARLLAVSETYEAEPIISFLADLVQDGILQRGERGELAARLILTLAHDRAVEALVCKGDLPVAPWETPKPLTEDELKAEKVARTLHYSQPVPVCAFLDTLLGTGVWLNAILQSYADNVANSEAGVPLEDAFKDAYIHFTHFGYAEDTSILNDEGCWLAMARGMAWQCRSLKEPVDIVIPIFLGDKDKDKLDRTNMSALFIQTTVQPWDKMHRRHVDADTLSFFTPSSDATDNRPYVSIIMNLGARYANYNAMINHEPPILSTESSHPRYSVTISGLLYPGLHFKIARLLAPQSNIYSHLNGLKWSVSPLPEHMKPIWRKGNACFTWAQANSVGNEAGNVGTKSSRDLDFGVSVGGRCVERLSHRIWTW